MKKVFFVAVASIVLFSCVKEGPAGKDGEDGTQINTYYFDVFPNHWKNSGTYGSAGHYCYEERTLPALTSSVLNEGAVLVYVIFDDTYNHQLPHIEPFYDNGYYIRTIRYDLQPGKVAFIVEDSDFKTLNPPYSGEKVQFKVVIISKI